MWKRLVVLAIAAALAASNARADEPPSVEAESRRERADRARHRPGQPADGSDVAIQLGAFWLGVECYPAPPTLVEQLGLSDHGGLVVEHVVPDSPAERAGLKRHDVIVAVGEKPVFGIPELVAAINEAGEEELRLEVIRRGERRDVTATPAPRSSDDQHRVWDEPPDDEDLDRLWRWFGRIGPEQEWRRPFRLHFFHPGAILPPGAELHPPLPDNLSVTISKKGRQPVKIVVTRDDNEWELTEHDLEELPDDVRPHVERMLGRAPAGDAAGFRILPRSPGRLGEAEPKPESPDAEGRPALEPEQMQRHMESQLDEMGRRMEEMRRSLDRWRRYRESTPQVPGP